MTTIQAIDLLKGLEQSLDDYCELNGEGKTAFRMAITALEQFGISELLPSAQPERQFEIQDILDYLDTVLHPIISPKHWNVYSELHDMISTLPSVQPQPEEDCDTCKHGYFGDRQCDNCRVRYPSHYEREEEHHEG